MSSFVLCEVSFWWECLFTCFTIFFNFHCASATIELVFLQTILLCVHILTLFTLKLASTSFATPMSQTLHCVDISNVLLQNISCVELSFTDVTVGLVFLVVFSIVLVETKWTAEFFSTIGTLILNVHRSKSGSQLKSSTISKTVSASDFWQTLSLHLIQILFATFYSFSTFRSGVFPF